MRAEIFSASALNETHRKPWRGTTPPYDANGGVSFMGSRTYQLQTHPHTRYSEYFGWRILENGNAVRLSTKPYPTESEANAAGLAVVKELERLRELES